MHFIFDANLSFRLSDGLEILEKGDTKSAIKKIDHADKLVGKGATDPDIIRIAGKTHAIIISQDDDFKRIKSNKELIKQLKVGYVMYRPPKHGSRYWEIVQSFILGWPEIKRVLASKRPPFLYQINKDGKMQEVEL
ncbi:MAG: DUF5615 family PIN-like protein [Flavobacteriales bacterium]